MYGLWPNNKDFKKQESESDRAKSMNWADTSSVVDERRKDMFLDESLQGDVDLRLFWFPAKHSNKIQQIWV